MPEPTPNPSTLTDDDLEALNQALMRERATILAYQRDVAAEVERRAKDQRVAALQAALAAEGVGATQVLDAGEVASTATVHALGEADEVPWFTEPPEAVLSWSVEDGEPLADDSTGHLRFTDPKGQYASVWVTPGPTRSIDGANVWHIDVDDNGATVSPSVHYVGHWHTPNPVRFVLVNELA